MFVLLYLNPSTNRAQVHTSAPLWCCLTCCGLQHCIGLCCFFIWLRHCTPVVLIVSIKVSKKDHVKLCRNSASHIPTTSSVTRAKDKQTWQNDQILFHLNLFVIIVITNWRSLAESQWWLAKVVLKVSLHWGVHYSPNQLAEFHLDVGRKGTVVTLKGEEGGWLTEVKREEEQQERWSIFLMESAPQGGRSDDNTETFPCSFTRTHIQ